MDIDVARGAFANAIGESDLVPSSVEIVTRADPALGEAAAFHCRWPLIEKGPYSGKYSREITVKITTGAMDRFRSAEAKARGAMLTQFVRVLNVRLREGGYDAKDPPAPPFIVYIDEHSLEP